MRYIVGALILITYVLNFKILESFLLKRNKKISQINSNIWIFILYFFSHYINIYLNLGPTIIVFMALINIAYIFVYQEYKILHIEQVNLKFVCYLSAMVFIWIRYKNYDIDIYTLLEWGRYFNGNGVSGSSFSLGSVMFLYPFVTLIDNNLISLDIAGFIYFILITSFSAKMFAKRESKLDWIYIIFLLTPWAFIFVINIVYMSSISISAIIYLQLLILLGQINKFTIRTERTILIITLITLGIASLINYILIIPTLCALLITKIGIEKISNYYIGLTMIPFVALVADYILRFSFKSASLQVVKRTKAYLNDIVIQISQNRFLYLYFLILFILFMYLIWKIYRENKLINLNMIIMTCIVFIQFCQYKLNFLSFKEVQGRILIFSIVSIVYFIQESKGKFIISKKNKGGESYI